MRGRGRRPRPAAASQTERGVRVNYLFSLLNHPMVQEPRLGRPGSRQRVRVRVRVPVLVPVPVPVTVLVCVLVEREGGPPFARRQLSPRLFVGGEPVIHHHLPRQSDLDPTSLPTRL
eukprot:COSAG05_NODE_152_length_15898_cov_21.995000_17_plen_117_part_00